LQRTLYEAEHEDLRRSAQEFLDRHVIPRHEEFVRNKAFSRDVWIEAGKQGFLGVLIPEQYGGGGAGDDYRFSTVLAEVWAGFSIALASCMGIHGDVNAPYLVELSSEEQRQRWLPRFCTGELWTAMAMTEPAGGSDLKALRTTAVRDGDVYVVNGSKTFITNGYSADLVITAVRTDPAKGARGISLLAIETGMAGFTRGRKLDKVGQEESDTAELFFDEVRVPVANRLGEEGAGFVAMMERLPQERIGAAVSNLANARAILEETVAYSKQRHAFGQPVGSFQANKFLLAELVTKVDVTQAYVDQAVLAHCRKELTATEAAKAKWWSAQVQNEVLDACVQLYGGYGYMNEYRVARAWRDARVTKIWAGSNEIMKELIGRELGL
jgi:long-chain-acyl-CoA dehydrogenase